MFGHPYLFNIVVALTDHFKVASHKRATVTIIEITTWLASQIQSKGVHKSTMTTLMVLFIGRCLLAVHFAAELVDKVFNFDYWVQQCRDGGQPLPQAEMCLVVALLLYGTSLLFFDGRPSACFALLIVQIPTTVWFEDTIYTQLDSVSVMGGLLLAAAVHWEGQAEAQAGVNTVNDDGRLLATAGGCGVAEPLVAEASGIPV